MIALLLLEDDVLDAELIKRSLAEAKLAFDVRWVRSGTEFCAALQSTTYGLILSDYSLPGFSGPDALVTARQLQPDTPFIFVSGVVGEEHAVDVLKAGATDYVTKHRLERLPFVVQRALRERDERQQRLESERALREQATVFARVVESLRDYAVTLLDADGCIRRSNQAFLGLFGDTAQGRPGSAAQVFAVEGAEAAGQDVASLLAQAAVQGSAALSGWLRGAGGRRFYGTGMVTRLDDDDGQLNGYSVIVRDETDARETAEALRSAKDEAERANRAKDRFIAVMSHELRTPLTPIAFAAQVLETKAELPPALSSLLPMIRRNIALETRLIDDLLDVTIIEQGKFAIHRASIDLHEVVEAAVEAAAGDIERAGLKLDLLLDGRETQMDGDAARLQQVVGNLLRNAIKFSRPGGRIVLATRDLGGRVELRCTDEGVGIDDEAMKRIFEPFNQGNVDTWRRFGGLGLGLSIARHITQLHGGDIRATSAGKDRGTTFTLTLPASRPPGPETRAAALESSVLHLGLRTLIVEDNEDAREALTYLLEDAGCEVVGAGTVAAGVAALKASSFDLTLCDVGLPDGSGLQVPRLSGASCPFIALTGYGTAEDIRASRASGFAGHLTKPVDIDELLALMKELSQRQPELG